ncbi:MAG: MBL fold metallo-hydrolase [Halobacteriaceae archaeon]
MSDADPPEESGADREYPEPPVPVDAVSAADLYARIRRDDPVSVLDTRNRDEFEQWRVTGPGVEAAQVPYVNFVSASVRGSEAVADLVAETGLAEPVVVVCARGRASAHVAGLLVEAGVEAVNLAGGMRGWARLYVASDLPHADAMVRQYYRPSSGCLAYLVVADGEAAVVDPLHAVAGRYADDAAEHGADLRWAVDTHVHADHVSGVRDVAAATDATPVLPAGARDRGLDFEATLLDDGETLPVGDVGLEAVHAPGHTHELTALRLGDLLFTGDALFLDSVGRPDLEAGDEGAPALARAAHDSLHDRLFALPSETRVAPGHVAPDAVPDTEGRFSATLAAVREATPLAALDRAAFVDRLTGDLPPRPANYERVVAVNLGRETVADAEAFELELGPNNCAV